MIVDRIRNWPIVRLFAREKPEAPTTPSGPGPGEAGEIGYADSVLYTAKDFPKYNPDLLLQRKGKDIYRKMMLDDQVKAVLGFKRVAVVSRDWYFDVGTDDAGEKRGDHEDMAEFFKSAVKKIKGTFTKNMTNILSALQNGFSITEKVFTPIKWRDKIMWGIQSLKLRPFDSFDGGFECDPHGNILRLRQLQVGNARKIPLSKVIHFVHQPDIDEHYGESDLRAAYRSWWSKDITIKFQNIHLERHAGGFIWAQVKGRLTGGQKTDLENLLKNVSARMGAHLPDTVTLNQFNPLRTDAYDRAMAQHDKAIAKSLLVPNLLGLSEQGETGSYSQSQTQFDVFCWILDSIANDLAETLNEQMFKQLALWNFGTDDYPPFCFEPISEAQKIELAKTWKELVAGNAVTKSDSDEAWIRQLIGAPEKAEPEEPEATPDKPGDDDETAPMDVPENEQWIEDQEDPEAVRKEMAEKPWMRRVNFARIEETLNTQDDRFMAEMLNIMARVRTSVESQIIKIVGQRSLGNVKPQEIEAVKIPVNLVSGLRKTIRDNLQTILKDGYEMARKELPKKQHAAIRPGMDKTQAEKFLSRKAMKIAGVIEQDVLKGVSRVLENGIRYDKTLKQTIDAISDDTDLLKLLPETDAAGRPINKPARIENIARTNTSDALNTARTALFGEPELKGFVLASEYSAVLDNRISEICEHLHGKILKDFGVYTPPNHHMCRALLVPVTIMDDWDGKESPKPRLQPQKGFA